MSEHGARTPTLNEQQMEFLSMIEKEYIHHLITEATFREQMLKLGFLDWEVDEYVDDQEAEEP